MEDKKKRVEGDGPSEEEEEPTAVEAATGTATGGTGIDWRTMAAAVAGDGAEIGGGDPRRTVGAVVVGVSCTAEAVGRRPCVSAFSLIFLAYKVFWSFDIGMSKTGLQFAVAECRARMDEWKK